MNILRWPEKMPESESGRLPEGPDAYGIGRGKVADPRGSCERTLHVSLFFDGTNNNDHKDNDWRDSNKESHTNVARLFDAAIDRPEQDMFAYYIAGVGTPFPEIGEETYCSLGKALAAGFAKRCVWGYTRVLNALYRSVMNEVPRPLISDSVARKICEALDDDKSSPELKQKENILAVSQKSRKQDAQWNRVIKKVWINVFGFSRGAAAARVFVNKLMKEWAPDGKIVGSIPYEVNFVGLFDTVASVGLPDSVNGVFKADTFDGHFEWASDGGLNIPTTVKRCVHFISIHEQRMSFPLDTLRVGDSYPQNAARLFESPYPGVHSDVGGGYEYGEQGKSCDGDHHKLSCIPLHDMYIEALRAGVPLMLHDEIWESRRLRGDFAISKQVAQAFNAWLDKVIPISSVEDALEYGMRQNLLWRTLRARIGTGQCIQNQAFYKASRQHPMTPNQVRLQHEIVQEKDAVLQALLAEQKDLRDKRNSAEADVGRESARGDFSAAAASRERVADIKKEIAARQRDIDRRKEALYARVAGKDEKEAKPGEGPDEIVGNDRTDLLEGAEDFRLLLAALHPDQRDIWQVEFKPVLRPPSVGHLLGGVIGAVRGTIVNSGMRPCVVRQSRPASDSQMVVMLNADVRMMLAAKMPYSGYDDVVLEPAPEMVDYLRKWTSTAAVDRFQIQEKAAIKLFDDYIHDSRAWFRVPHFHEYAPGGYGWARTFFVGDDVRVRHLGIKTKGVLDYMREVADSVEKTVRSARDKAVDAVSDAVAQGADAILDGAAEQGKRALDKVFPSGLPFPRL